MEVVVVLIWMWLLGSLFHVGLMRGSYVADGVPRRWWHVWLRALTQSWYAAAFVLGVQLTDTWREARK